MMEVCPRPALILFMSLFFCMVCKISGSKTFELNGKPFYAKGINWNPIGKGGTHPNNIDFIGYVSRDAALMKAAGVNVVRNYHPITNNAVLDKLWEHGIYLIASVYPWGGSEVSSVDSIIAATKNHPCILMWYIGNEWNYNGLYVGLSQTAATNRIAEVAARVKLLDKNHPIATIYGELPSSATISALSDIDIWGLNVYRGESFGDLFDKWNQLNTKKPMFIGEYGADAWDSRSNFRRENQEAQAIATTKLANEIVSKRNSGCFGGILFEFADEWWKDKSGSPSNHDTGGVAPGSGPPPDGVFNEEWWGIVDIDRNPRSAYYAYQATSNFTQVMQTPSPSPNIFKPITNSSKGDPQETLLHIVLPISCAVVTAGLLVLSFCRKNGYMRAVMNNAASYMKHKTATTRTDNNIDLNSSSHTDIQMVETCSELWQEAVDPSSGDKYFYNIETGESKWSLE